VTSCRQANRRNALKSTGPRTKAGQLQSRQLAGRDSHRLTWESWSVRCLRSSHYRRLRCSVGSRARTGAPSSRFFRKRFRCKV